jgi:hypothetical protein
MCNCFCLFESLWHGAVQARLQIFLPRNFMEESSVIFTFQLLWPNIILSTLHCASGVRLRVIPVRPLCQSGGEKRFKGRSKEGSRSKSRSRTAEVEAEADGTEQNEAGK